ncbi:hypothetical protein [Calothrix sp. NIES-2098]
MHQISFVANLLSCNGIIAIALISSVCKL